MKIDSSGVGSGCNAEERKSRFDDSRKTLAWVGLLSISPRAVLPAALPEGARCGNEHRTGHFGRTARDHRGSPLARLLGVDRTAAVSAVGLAAFPDRQDRQDHVLPEPGSAVDP